MARAVIMIDDIATGGVGVRIHFGGKAGSEPSPAERLAAKIGEALKDGAPHAVVIEETPGSAAAMAHAALPRPRTPLRRAPRGRPR